MHLYNRQQLMVICFLLIAWCALQLLKTGVAAEGAAAATQRPLFVYELRGQVPHEGFYCFYQEQTIADLLEASGAAGRAVPVAASGPVANGTSILLGEHVQLQDLAAAARLNFFLPVSVNAARAEDLRLIPGLGMHTALAITAYRDARGGIHDLRELAALQGMSEKKLAALLPYLTR